MKFHVGPVEYRLVVSDRAIFDETGNELEGLAVESRRLLIISYRVEPQRREDIALHELLHAWAFHVPPPRNEEERCQLFALAARQFRIEIEDQGGAEAFEQMLPVRVPHLGRPLPQRTPGCGSVRRRRTDRVTCGQCDATIMCGSIHNGEPALHAYTALWRLDRWARCPCCATLLAWTEICAPDGTPLGEYVANPPPRMLRGREATHWLAERNSTKAQVGR